MPLRRASALRPARPPSPRRTKSSVSHLLQCCHTLRTLTRSCASYTTMVRISHALMVLHASELSISPSIHPQYCTVLRLTIRRTFVFLGISIPPMLTHYHPVIVRSRNSSTERLFYVWKFASSALALDIYNKPPTPSRPWLLASPEVRCRLI